MPDCSDEHDSEDLVRLSVFSSIGKSIVAENSIRGVLDRVMEHVGSFFGPLNWSILLVDGDANELVFTVVVGKAAEALTGRRVPVGEGIAGWVARHGKPAIVDMAQSDPRFSERFDAISGFVTESIVAVPLLAGGKVFGVIELLNRLDGKAFSAFDMRVLSTISDFAAIAIEKSYYLAEAKRLSEIDPLTGALNRRGLTRIIEREGAKLKRYHGDLSIIMGDVDGFKLINDKHGHQAGDDVLKSVAGCLHASIRQADAVARFGGDEFVVVMPQTGPEEAEIARARLQAALDSAGQSFPIKYSVTLGVHSSSQADFGELFRESDRDLYRRKEGPLAIAENLLAALDDEAPRP
jgi:diguanylate cyclase (GGDEF)-like protein